MFWEALRTSQAARLVLDRLSGLSWQLDGLLHARGCICRSSEPLLAPSARPCPLLPSVARWPLLVSSPSTLQTFNVFSVPLLTCLRRVFCRSFDPVFPHTLFCILFSLSLYTLLIPIHPLNDRFGSLHTAHHTTACPAPHHMLAQAPNPHSLQYLRKLPNCPGPSRAPKILLPAGNRCMIVPTHRSINTRAQRFA